MTEPKSTTDPTAEFDPTTFIVDQEYVDLVTARLVAEPGVTVTGTPEVSARLGLACLSGIEIAESYPEAAIADCERDPTLRLTPPTFEQWRELQGPAAEPADLDHRYYRFDVLTSVVRARIRRDYGNWAPPTGKGRMTVVGTPQSKATDDPIPANRPHRPMQGLGDGVRVALLDTPVTAHADLPDTVVSASTMYAGTIEHPKRAGHGTFVAGLIRGEASAAHLRAVGVLDSADGRASAWAVAKALVELADAGYDIVNLSLGSRTLDGEVPLLFARALARLGPDTLVIASAGNRGEANNSARKLPVWPAAEEGVVAVGAWDSGLTPNLPWVTCTAQGELVSAYLTGKVVLTDPPGLTIFDGYALWGGSSFATASVSGKIAARMVPGRVGAREAFARLLDAPDSGVHRHVAD
ncbi:S8 family peptidase [Actinophytocola sediminis]